MREIAEGGFGKVYLAEMLSGDFSTIVVLKLLHGKWADNVEILQRSRDEARVLGRLRHPNIVRVDDLTSINNQCAVVMEYVEGVNLKVLLKWLERSGDPFPPKAAFAVIADVADALDAAYNTVPLQEKQALHLIHRDVKPSNIMIAPTGHVKLLDFGTAKARFESRESKTQAMTFGSKGYMSPERMMQEGDTPAGDIFSLGVMLYWLLAGQQLGDFPLRPSRYDEYLEARLATINPSRLGDPTAHDDVRNVLRVLLSYEHTQRPSAAQVLELCEILGDAVGGGSLRAFCRNTVPPILEAWRAHTDGKGGNDLVGSILHEDRTSSMPYTPAAAAAAVARRSLELPAPSLRTFATELPELTGVDAPTNPTLAENSSVAALLSSDPDERAISEILAEADHTQSRPLEELSLAQKLKQDVSVRSLKSVLTHEFRFGRRKK